mmetsp:Transcript_105896/g.178866  ORF Transcript_105896/g.178866 Transcript_105896/m.178866 type:complete len:138 (+) Transcript_105896:58-471(+)
MPMRSTDRRGLYSNGPDLVQDWPGVPSFHFLATSVADWLWCVEPPCLFIRHSPECSRGGLWEWNGNEIWGTAFGIRGLYFPNPLIDASRVHWRIGITCPFIAGAQGGMCAAKSAHEYGTYDHYNADHWYAYFSSKHL